MTATGQLSTFQHKRGRISNEILLFRVLKALVRACSGVEAVSALIRASRNERITENTRLSRSRSATSLALDRRSRRPWKRLRSRRRRSLYWLERRWLGRNAGDVSRRRATDRPLRYPFCPTVRAARPKSIEGGSPASYKPLNSLCILTTALRETLGSLRRRE